MSCIHVVILKLMQLKDPQVPATPTHHSARHLTTLTQDLGGREGGRKMGHGGGGGGREREKGRMVYNNETHLTIDITMINPSLEHYLE